MTLVELFRCFRHVRETEPNSGQRVEAIQKWGGGKKGDSWCCYLATMVIDLFYRGWKGQAEAPIPRTGACDDVLNLARDKGWLRDTPAIGDLFLFIRDPDGPAGPLGMVDAYHIGMVADIRGAEFLAIAGNTSADGKSHNGTGCYEHWMGVTARMKFVRLP